MAKLGQYSLPNVAFLLLSYRAPLLANRYARTFKNKSLTHIQAFTHNKRCVSQKYFVLFYDFYLSKLGVSDVVEKAGLSFSQPAQRPKIVVEFESLSTDCL